MCSGNGNICIRSVVGALCISSNDNGEQSNPFPTLEPCKAVGARLALEQP